MHLSLQAGPFPLLDFFILFSGSLSVLMSIAQLTRPNRKFLNNYFGVVFLGTGFVILYFHAYLPDPAFDYTFFAAPILFLLLYATSPLHYLIAYKVIIEDIDLKKRNTVHFIPALTAAILSTLNTTGLLNVRRTLPWNDTREINLVQYFLLVLWFIQLLSYESILVIRFFRKRQKDDDRRTAYPILYSIIFLIFILGLVLISQLLLSSSLALTGLALVSVLVITWNLFTYRYPDLYPNLNAALGRYELTHTKGLDRISLRNRLNELMESENIYCDEDLSLARLASLLDLSPHQLSEFLNRELGESFSTYLNRHRIEEAKRMLRQDPARSILSIAMAVGFNSKSVFYRAFTRHTNMSPQKFRKNLHIS
ncbi:MAG: hypothetical protein CVV44_14675 [Spirochaetae bacterium HGW-Spirochaetae-1]|jgi:AraC-like DNA-binding protein|nr:MAG: hypothetical protein CVV44_14675 [Spirochaetae bacterium HGW-Spirochaetae-1]